MAKAPDRKVSVIIPTWQRGDLLRGCLESLRRQTFSDFAIVLVSNGAGSWVNPLAEEFACAVLSFSVNRGFAAAVNAGVAATRSRYLALLNDDVELDQAWLERTTALLEERPDLSFCCGKTYQVVGNVLDGMGDALSLGGSAWRLGYGRKDSPEFDLAQPLFAISCTASLFRRAVFEQLGGLDEDFFSYLEDMDFSLRALRAGCQGLYLPQAVCRHWGGATLGGPASPAVIRLLTRNQLVLLAKHFPGTLLWQLAPRIAWAQLLWALMALRRWRAWAYLAGLAGFVRLLPRTIRKRRSWQQQEWREFLTRLEQSEATIYRDQGTRNRNCQDTFWRLYFALFPPRQAETAY